MQNISMDKLNLSTKCFDLLNKRYPNIKQIKDLVKQEGLKFLDCKAGPRVGGTIIDFRFTDGEFIYQIVRNVICDKVECFFNVGIA